MSGGVLSSQDRVLHAVEMTSVGGKTFQTPMPSEKRRKNTLLDLVISTGGRTLQLTLKPLRSWSAHCVRRTNAVQTGLQQNSRFKGGWYRAEQLVRCYAVMPL